MTREEIALSDLETARTRLIADIRSRLTGKSAAFLLSLAEGGLDPRIRIIARAIGRQIAREHYAAWERTRRRQAANDNAAPEREEEGRKPEG